MSRFLVALSFVLSGIATAAEAPPLGFQRSVAVKQPTRLEWEFAAAGFGKEALKLPADYDSRMQRFQLFVPKTYKADRAWPLIVFISPGDDPLGWRYWQKVCEAQEILFCAPFAAGNNCPSGKRVRIVLDMLDQVRRDYRIDADRTYLTGFSGGGRMACTIAYALPEFFGGVIPVCGTNPLSNLDYLRHRAQDRLSVAFVTGETDFNRAENEKYMFPFVKDAGIRTRLWVVPKMGHGVPGDGVLAEVKKWLDDDLPRRKEDLKNRPTLACPPDDALTPAAQAARLLQAAEAELQNDQRVWRGVTMLQGIAARWSGTESGKKARKLLDELKEDERRLKLAGEQGGQDERTFLMAQAEALGRFGKTAAALQAWKMLAEQHPFSAEGRKAQAEVRRLAGAAANKPYLGIAFSGGSTLIDKVIPGGPGDKAGLKPGDRLRNVDTTRITDLTDLRGIIDKIKPGDKVSLTVERKGQMLTVSVEVGTMPTSDPGKK
jgi:dienelactone hydrolase